MPVGQGQEVGPDALDIAVRFDGARSPGEHRRTVFAKTILVVDEGSLASTVQARDLLRIANEVRIPRVVLVGDAKQLDAVDAGTPFAQPQGEAYGASIRRGRGVTRTSDDPRRQGGLRCLRFEIEGEPQSFWNKTNTEDA